MKDFNKRFGIETNTNQAIKKFIARVDVAVFSWFESKGLWKPVFLKWLSVKMGEMYHKYILQPPYSFGGKDYISEELSLTTICKNNFQKCIYLLEAIYEYTNKCYPGTGHPGYVDSTISKLLNSCEADIGVYWQNGKFWPSGAEELDRPLKKDILTWIELFPNIKNEYEAALKASMEKKWDIVISKTYKCVDGLLKEYLNNNTGLHKNIKPFVKQTGLHSQWKGILERYCEYASDCERHYNRNEQKRTLNPEEAEAFLYLTGLIIRMCIQKINRKEKND